jgi:YD repeat-containing protein
MDLQVQAAPDFDRDCVLQILRAAFYRCAESDYAQGHIIGEEDVRASVYRYTRDALDLAPSWRVFSNLTAFEIAGPDAQSFKPDLTFFHSTDGHSTATVKLLAEIKHWPNTEEIDRDIQKLKRLSRSFIPDAPALAFFAILGTGFKDREVSQLELEYAKRYPDVCVWFRQHHGLYRGPWDPVSGLDPWRRRLRQIGKV